MWIDWELKLLDVKVFVAYSHGCTASCRLLWRPVWECCGCLWLQSMCQQWNLQCDWPFLLHLHLSKRWGFGPPGQVLHFIEDDRLNRTLLTDPSHFRVSGRDCCLVVFSPLPHPHPPILWWRGWGWGRGDKSYEFFSWPFFLDNISSWCKNALQIMTIKATKLLSQKLILWWKISVIRDDSKKWTRWMWF